jgi:hypothetical protein
MNNNDSKLIFEAYLNNKKILNELDYGAMDVGGSFGGVIKKAKAGELPGKGYLIGSIADSLGISSEEAANKLTSAVFSNLFKQQKATVAGQEVAYFNPAKNKDQFLVEVKKAIVKALDALKRENPSLKVPGSDAVRTYTARILANLGEFVTDVVPTKVGMKAPIAAVKYLRKAVVNAEKPSAEVESTEETYVRNNVRFIPEFQKVFAEMPDEIIVGKGKNLYTSDEFKEAIKDAVLQAFDEKKLKEPDFLENLISSIEYKNGFVLSQNKAEKEGEGTGEVTTIETDDSDTPTDILRDLGMWKPETGFDEFDKFSTV